MEIKNSFINAKTVTDIKFLIFRKLQVRILLKNQTGLKPSDQIIYRNELVRVFMPSAFDYFLIAGSGAGWGGVVGVTD